MKLSNFSQMAYDNFCKGFELAENNKFEEALPYYLIAAKLGANDAQLNLANILDGAVVPRRPDEAVYWYKKAYRAGYDEAAWNLAIHYSMLGNRRRYIYWLKAAEKMGNSDASEERINGHWWRTHNKHSNNLLSAAG